METIFVNSDVRIRFIDSGHILGSAMITVKLMHEVAEVKGFSGHADKDDFQWLLRGAVADTGKVRLVHGDPQQMISLGINSGKWVFLTCSSKTTGSGYTLKRAHK